MPYLEVELAGLVHLLELGLGVLEGDAEGGEAWHLAGRAQARQLGLCGAQLLLVVDEPGLRLGPAALHRRDLEKKEVHSVPGCYIGIKQSGTLSVVYP